MLGGCSIFKKEYVCTVPFSLSDDTGELMTIAEEVYFSKPIDFNYLVWFYFFIIDANKEKLDTWAL